LAEFERQDLLKEVARKEDLQKKAMKDRENLLQKLKAMGDKMVHG
jgi:hypothetical protein